MEYKTAFVTGASSGLGHGLARWLSERGLRVFVAARRMNELTALAAAAPAGAITPVELDVADPDATMKAVQEADDACGGLDLVIANAGVGEETPAKRMKWERVARTIDVNVTGAAATLVAVLPRMVERDRGHLVGVSSIAAFRGMPRSAAYCASKAFLTTFLQGLRADLLETRLRVTAIHPGFVKSEMTAKNKFHMPFLLETEDAVARMGEAILDGRASLTFPWQMAVAIRALTVLPDPLVRAITRR